MNNKNWVAVFFGLAALVLFVSVMGASNNWMNNGTNNDTVPQQINQTVRGMDNTNKDNLPTKIDGNEILNDMTNGMGTPTPTPSTSPTPSVTTPQMMQ